MAETPTGPWHVARPKAPDHRALDSLAQDVAMVLKRMGGAAHQNVVVECVAALKRQRGEAVTSDLRVRIIEVFERYRDLFVRPFGEGSQRWALAPGAA